MIETLEQRMRRDLEAWMLAKALIARAQAKARGA